MKVIKILLQLAIKLLSKHRDTLSANAELYEKKSKAYKVAMDCAKDSLGETDEALTNIKATFNSIL